MATVVITHEVEDVQHWLSSPRRGEGFGPLGYTVRTFIDPANEHRVGLIFEGPGLEPLLEAVETPEVQESMKYDGVRPETIQTYVEA